MLYFGTDCCPLCDASSPIFHAQTRLKFGSRTWLRCSRCDLVFVQRGDLPSAAAEQAEYLRHENSIDDPRYVAFFTPFIEQLLPYLSRHAKGLDYGSGPSPVLAQLLERHGFAVEIYDYQFAPDQSVFSFFYDFVTSTEVFEHFHNPKVDLARISGRLRPDGILAVMTSLRDENQPFLDWYYIREESHVCFYSPQTMTWIAETFGFKTLRCDGRITIFARS